MVTHVPVRVVAPLDQKIDVAVGPEVIAQGGARMDLHPDVQAAAAHVRTVYDLGVTYFDCARSYWDGRSEEAYGIGLQGIRNNVFLTTKTQKRTAKEAEQDLESLYEQEDSERSRELIEQRREPLNNPNTPK